MIGSIASLACGCRSRQLLYAICRATRARNVQWFAAGALVGGMSNAIWESSRRYWMERRAGRVLFRLPWTLGLFSKFHRAILLPGQLALATALARS